MAGGVVDQLELIQVDVQQRLGAGSCGDRRGHAGQPPLELAPVVQPGQLIVAGLVAQQLVQLPLLADVGGHHHQLVATIQMDPGNRHAGPEPVVRTVAQHRFGIAAAAACPAAPAEARHAHPRTVAAGSSAASGSPSRRATGLVGVGHSAISRHRPAAPAPASFRSMRESAPRSHGNGDSCASPVPAHVGGYRAATTPAGQQQADQDASHRQGVAAQSDRAPTWRATMRGAPHAPAVGEVALEAIGRHRRRAEVPVPIGTEQDLRGDRR